MTIRAAIQTFADACVVPPDGAAEARPIPRLTVTRATAPQVTEDNGRRFTLLATSSVNGSSMMKMGWTRATGPVARATAWATAASMTIPIPASHTFRLIR